MEFLSPIQGIDIYLLDQFLKGRLDKSMRILDAGCGYGRNIRTLVAHGYDVTAIDPNPESIAELQLAFPAAADRFVHSSIEAYAPDQKFDFVIVNAVLHFARNHAHFAEMFAHLVEFLAPDGLLFIRMTSNIGLEDRLAAGHEGVHVLPDGSTRYLLTRPQVDDLVHKHHLQQLESVKTVFVDGLRSMTTLVFKR